MPDELKKALISMGITFSSTFLTALGTSLLMVGQVPWTTSIIAGLLVAAVRAGVKAVIDQGVPVRLGGKKV